MKKALRPTLVAMLLLGMGSLLNACGDSTSCSAGTVKQGGKCVPQCSTEQFWNGSACEALPSSVCAAGTEKDADGNCVPACADTEYWNGTACVLVPECAPGTSLDNTGDCVPDVVCGSNTHPENGQCVPNVLPDPQVPEATEPNDPTLSAAGMPAVFELAAVGDSVTLGGTIQAPTDWNGDGLADSDWDYFAFMADAGTYLRFESTSEGAAVPAYLIMGVDMDTSELVYFRGGVNPNGLNAVREAYLPVSAFYLVAVTDYNNFVEDFAGDSGISTGGPDYTYFMTIETLTPPTPTELAIGSKAATTGNFADGSLSFFNVTGLTVGSVISAFMPGVPVEDTENDAVPGLMIFDPAGNYVGGYYAEYMMMGFFGPEGLTTEADLTAMFAANTSGNYLLVVDNFWTLGPNTDWALELAPVPVKDCDASPADCQNFVLADGMDYGVLKFQLLAGDFLAFMVNGCPFDAVLQLTDMDLSPLAFADSGYDDEPESGFVYTDTDTYVYAIVNDWYFDGANVNTDWVVESAGAMTLGTEFTGTTYAMPFLTEPSNADYPDGPAIGFSAVDLLHDTIVYSQGMNPVSGNWDAPMALLEYFGMPLNPWIYDPYSGKVEQDPRPMAWLPVDGNYQVHVADSADITGAQYSLTLNEAAPQALGAVGLDSPVSASGLDVDANTGVAFLTFTAEKNWYYFITVDPNGSDLQANVASYMLTYMDSDGYITPASNGYQFLQYDTAAQAGAPGDTVEVSQTSWYAGTYVIMVENVNGAAASTTFDITIERAHCVPDMQRCNGNDLEICASDAWEVETTCDAGCVEDFDDDYQEYFYYCGSLDLDGGETCDQAVAIDTSSMPVNTRVAGTLRCKADDMSASPGGLTADGPDAYYALQLQAGDQVYLQVSEYPLGWGDSGDVVLYIMNGCDPSAGGFVYAEADNTDWSEELNYTAPAAGTYYVGVDSVCDEWNGACYNKATDFVLDVIVEAAK